MAYMDQDKKKEIAAELKLVVPKDWKYSLSVHNHSSITMTIKSAPVDLIGLCKNKHGSVKGHIQLNEHFLSNSYEGDVLSTLEKIVKALNTGNFDKSDSQSDYFHVGFYSHLHLGKWDKPFEVKA